MELHQRTRFRFENGANKKTLKQAWRFFLMNYFRDRGRIMIILYRFDLQSFKNSLGSLWVKKHISLPVDEPVHVQVWDRFFERIYEPDAHGI